MEFDFAQHTKVADINKVPQDFRGLYKANDDGSHVLDAENPAIKSSVSAITGLNNALKAARLESKNKTTVDLSPLKDYGDNPEGIAQTVQQKLKDLTDQIKGVNVEKIKGDLAQEWTGKLTNEQKKAQALEKQLHSELVESRAVGAIAAENGDPELLMPFVTRHLKTSLVNDKYVVQVVDGAGDIRYSGVTGAPMSIKELVAEMKANAKYGTLFKSEAPAGGGASPGAATRPNPATNPAAAQRNTAEMSPVQKIAQGLKKGKFTR